MQFRADQYYQASLERMEQSRRIYQAGRSYALAIYCAGLAVEALLRAFRWTVDTSFEGRHDLGELLKASRLLLIDEEVMRRKGKSEDEIEESRIRLEAAMSAVIILWHNNLRFASEASLKSFLNKLNRLQGIRGDPLKKNALDVLNAAQLVINHGGSLWTSNKRS